ncbi:hypothetical protein CJU90_3323 [Yarrowia sp. C11]|nr:hypothetical protein CKK34_4769 [Yarrowia sp. E02]KAG5369793.1 hypothetical protein CJU90_3323 [Yarrowia sp. C11]
MDSITKGYPPKVIEETENLVERYTKSRDPDYPLSTLNLWKQSSSEPLSRFAKSGQVSIDSGERLSDDLMTVAALSVALKIHSQFDGFSAVLQRLPKPASHSALVVAERHLLEAIGYDLVGKTDV